MGADGTVTPVPDGQFLVCPMGTLKGLPIVKLEQIQAVYILNL